jgi:hypothetical protein
MTKYEMLFDTARVIGKFFYVLGAHIYDIGFERREFYILRGDQRVIVCWNTADGPPPEMPKRLKPVKIVFPGWSYFTRLPCFREYEVRYKWL